MCDVCEEALLSEIDLLREEIGQERAAKVRAIDAAAAWEKRVRDEHENNLRLARRIVESDSALDAGGAPRERDGRTLTLAERIAEALPPPPESTGEWERGTDGAWIRNFAPLDGVALVTRIIEQDGRSYIGILGREDDLDMREARAVLAGLRLALGPAGIPPTERKPSNLPPTCGECPEVTTCAPDLESGWECPLLDCVVDPALAPPANCPRRAPPTATAHGMPACATSTTFTCRGCGRATCACAGVDDATPDLCDTCHATARGRTPEGSCS